MHAPFCMSSMSSMYSYTQQIASLCIIFHASRMYGWLTSDFTSFLTVLSMLGDWSILVSALISIQLLTVLRKHLVIRHFSFSLLFTGTIEVVNLPGPNYLIRPDCVGHAERNSWFQSYQDNGRVLMKGCGPNKRMYWYLLLSLEVPVQLAVSPAKLVLQLGQSL